MEDAREKVESWRRHYNGERPHSALGYLGFRGVRCKLKPESTGWMTEMTMKIQINYGDIEHSDAISEHVTQAVEAALALVVDRVTRVEVHLRDDKKNRRGPDDHRCVMEARLAGEQPLAVEARTGDIYDAVKQCADKLKRAVTRKLERSS